MLAMAVPAGSRGIFPTRHPAQYTPVIAAHIPVQSSAHPSSIQTRLPALQSPPRPCSTCGRPVFREGKCRDHYKQAERRRGSPTERGYGSRHENVFRAYVLKRDPICVLCGDYAATHADHYPQTRRQLVKRGLDPDDPQYGRGLCASCHNGWTASQTRSQ